jgi:hypothetical protein
MCMSVPSRAPSNRTFQTLFKGRGEKGGRAARRLPSQPFYSQIAMFIYALILPMFGVGGVMSHDLACWHAE